MDDHEKSPVTLPQEVRESTPAKQNRFRVKVNSVEELKFASFCSLQTFMASEAAVVHTGGCHCRRVRWQVEAPASVVAWICNCSNCSMRGNTHFIVPAAKFRLQPGADEFITTYTFGTHTAKHTFCKVCGITSFYTPRSNPDGVAVTVACVDPGTVKHVEYRKFDGGNWENFFKTSDIAGFSKDKAEAAE